MVNELIQISKLSLPVIALASVFIAWQQYSANREKLRLELYDRRFKIYDLIVQSIYIALYGLGEFEGDELVQLYTACNEARFLLPDDIYKKVEKSQKHVRIHLELIRRRETLKESSENSEEFSKIQEMIEDSEPKLECLVDEVTKAFDQVLKIKKF